MARPDLRRLLPEAPAALRALLDAENAATGGAVHPPIRSEIFGLDRFAQHGRSLGVTHNAALADSSANTFFPRLQSNIDMLRQAQRYIGLQASAGEDISPAAEWLLDNFHLIEAQLKEIHDGLPGSYFRKLPLLIDEPLAGLPRVYGIAWAFVAHTDSAFDDDLLVQFLAAYQDTRELSLAELWALPTTLRVVLIENLRRLAERVATHLAARHLANLCADRAEPCTVPMLTSLLAQLNERGVGRVFLAQLAQRSQRVQDPNRHSVLGPSAVQAWLKAELPESVAEMAALQSVDQTANNLSVSNAVSSLRAIGDADWPDIVARTSPLMHLMLGAPLFEAEHPQTRDQTLHGIEKLARRSGRSEVEVAKALLALMHEAATPRQTAPIYWLKGAGRATLAAALGLQERSRVAWLAARRQFALPVYLGALGLLTVGLTAWLLRSSGGEPWPWQALLALLIVFPASEAVVAVINRLISESVQPRHLPRLGFTTGIPAEHRVLVVIPCMLTDPHGTTELVHRLRLHHLANPDQQVQFALLSDWADADTETTAGDAVLLDDACAKLRALNADSATGAPRFLLLHRTRRFSPSEQRWIGWERKRGKLEQLMATMAEATDGTEHFVNVGELSNITPGTRYVVTLDADTQLPPGRLRALVGVAAHPDNQPVLSADGRRVVDGWGILQPRVVTPLPAPRDLTRYHWLFAGQCGIDPYSAASSEVYQDLFDEGTFSGKGLLHVHAMHAVLAQRLPEGQVLSHDLLEGSLARCAAVTDITVVEEAPFHADVAAARVHRWTRGDWQLLPFLLPFSKHSDLPLRAINRWKMFDNLRRSLVAPMSLALLVLVLALGPDNGMTPLVALALVGAAYLAGPLMGAAASFSPSRDDLGLLPFYRQAVTDLLRALCGGAWLLVQLLHQALRALDAIVRALYRLTISHRLLLQWTTAAAAQAQAQSRLGGLARQHASTTAVGVVLAVALMLMGTPAPAWTLVLCALWAASPLWTWLVSRPRGGTDTPPVSGADADYLRGIARDTWRLFERCITAADRFLPPDNLQVVPHEMLAHRTSPTNIGLYLLSACCARQFGWIGSADLLTRLNDTLATLDTMQRHRGHFLNWYDTESGAPLLPQYVSTVDSGNFSGHLLAVAEALLALAEAPLDPAAGQRALAASRARIAPLLSLWPELLNNRPTLAQIWADDSGSLDAAQAELARLLPSAVAGEALLPASARVPSPLEQLSWLLADHLATLRSAALDRGADAAVLSTGLRAAAQRCKQLAWAPDYSFLYHRKRHLFHIGYRVAEQTLDASFYDLLASESRLTSLLAIAKGDVPVQHWASLGRPFFAVGMRAGLRSWSGSMFEYLMPTLVLNEPDGSVLDDASLAALHEQRAFAATQNVPWGISESAYAGQDHTLAYQYSPQGVPRLALRRTPPDELVIAPYATALAALVDAPHACRNFALLEAMGARGRYGLIEALDFSAARQTGSEGRSMVPSVPVATFMAHHQGMSIVALANVLLCGVAQRWGMGNAHIEAVSSLLHERAPREISKQGAPPPALPEHAAAARRPPGMLRELLPGMSAVEPTHLLSNGRYAVSLRPNGAGQSRWRQSGLSRWRDDALRDDYGSFFYVRWAAQPQAVSLTQHPAPDPAAHYQSSIHADRVCFDARWSKAELQAHITVWVSPEDDIEFRCVELRNGSDRALEIELISSFEVTLADPRADEAHPAFTNMFVSAEWLAAAQALLFKRQPRLEGEPSLHAAHFLTDNCPQITGLSVQTDRQRLLGRNASASQPLLKLDPAGTGDGPLQTGLDPVCTLAVRLRIEPNAKAQLTFATAVSDQAATLRAVIDKYRQPSHVQRASLMSATLASIRLREMTLSPEYFAAQQSLTTALLFTLARPGLIVPAQAVCDRRLLWRLSLSGDRPILLVSLDSMQGLSLVRGLAQALRVWAWGGVACDLVVVNGESASYEMALQRELMGLRERHVAQVQDGAQFGNATTFTLLRASELSPGEFETLHALARLHFRADGRPLTRHVQDWLAAHQLALEARQAGSVTALLPGLGRQERRRQPREAGSVTALLPLARSARPVAASQGSFANGSGEFRFDVSANQRPQRPWINVLANPDFGAQLSESGGGYSWAVNSRLMQLTPWSNDPVADPTAETFLIQDVESREAWSLTASALAAAETYTISHGQGSSTISHRHGALDIAVTWWVAEGSAVKRVRVQVSNRGNEARRLRIVGIVEWLMGAHRGDRAATLTALHSQRLEHGKLSAVLCTQNDHSAGFGEGTAFFGLADAAQSVDWTADRRECFDARGRLILPDHFGQHAGAGLDPCAALASRVDLAGGASAERVFLLGYAATPDAARQLAVESAAASAADSLAAVGQHWDKLLGATTVITPDPLFDALVNRWLLYQTLSCRLWAKAAFYQAGGATGFRDQLQDAMALTWTAPDMLRAQVLRCAARQFAEGDVQHWWHAPSGAGVRTHFSDDLLWLPFACLRYLHATGDTGLLDEPAPFLVGLPIPEGAEDRYDTPATSEEQASVYEHAARAIDHSLKVGVHGLPLMGSGDWNDGMNRVGIEGRGESVWLAWFLCAVVEGFAPLAGKRGEVARAQRWRAAAQGWQQSLMGEAWDGQWFKRAFFDDGSPLGTQANPEARIDLIAQAWSVLSNAAPAHLQRIAMAAVRSELFDSTAGLIRLLDPPLQHAVPSAGYIQAYPPGVRENGGQYSHAGVWALMAQAQHATSLTNPTERERASDLAWRYFTALSPAHRSAHPTEGPVYAIEPYVMAGDVYSQPPYVGRGGWSWYTGAAAWLHRASVESIFGLDQRADSLSFKPCLPSHWPRAELSLRRQGQVMRFILIRADAEDALNAAGEVDAVLLRVGELLAWPELGGAHCFVVPVA